MINKKNNLSNNESKLSSRKGISLVEVVVALTIISIISVAAFSLILSSMDLENDMMRDVEISAAADDVLDCFMFAKTKDDFTASIDVLGYDEDEDGVYTSNKGSYVLRVTYEENGETGEKHMTFLAWDVSSGAFLMQKEHTKG